MLDSSLITDFSYNKFLTSFYIYQMGKNQSTANSYHLEIKLN